MRTLGPCLAALALLAASECAGAASGMIKCVDSKGVTHYGDTLPPQCAGQGSATLNKRGIVVKSTERAPTAEEQKAKELETEKHRSEAQKDADQRRRDYALLASYTSEKEIDAARTRELQLAETRIAAAKAAQAKQVSAEEKARLDARIGVLGREIEEINARYDGYKARYVELKNAQKQQQASAGKP